ncbi:MAG TPA: DNA-3-methyladenine glycosylase [Cyclobacteriaceae bacterium]|nr:DNA-3-methyladenine glycosylase [Cyclobacteriaceae bacterium]
MSSLKLAVPEEFSFEHAFAFLQRSSKEPLHTVNGNSVAKVLRIDNELVLFTVKEGKGSLLIDFGKGTPSKNAVEAVKRYVREWFDLDTDLKPFYALARKDDLLKGIVKKYVGHRIISIPDLFESLIWAVLGQQINVAFAYTIKQRFVEQFGERFDYDGVTHYLFPTPQTVVQLTPDQLLPLQFSRQKANYTIGIAKAFVSGDLTREKLTGLSLAEAKEQLVKIKGIGNWTANYAMMRTFRHPESFPLEDVALHRAIQIQLGLRKKPSLSRVKKIFRKYKGWEAYATLYLWKSL